MNILFIAPPAAGKGTQSVRVSEKYNLPHISTGDLLRNCHDEEINKLINNGKFVSDEVVSKLLEERLNEDDCNNGFVLDGFPRNLKQAKMYENILKSLKKEQGTVFVLDTPKDIAEKRITGRVSCPNCGEVFNELIEGSKPLKKGLCNHCHHTLIKRNDDTKETFEKRYDTYEKETEPLIEYYEKQNVVYHVNSGVTAEHTFKQIEGVIDNILTRRW